MGTSIDIIGGERALEEFDYRTSQYDEPLFFSVWNGRQLKHSCSISSDDGARDELERMISMWQDTGSNAVFEVRLHDKKPTKALSNKTDIVGSYTFKLREKAEEYAPQYIAPQESFLEKVKEYEILKKHFDDMRQTEQPNIVGANWMDRVDKWLTTPIIEEVIIGVAKKIGLNIETNQQAMAGNKDANETVIIDTDSQEPESLEWALAVLADGEKDFKGLMVRLAKLKLQKPRQYALAKSML